MAGLKTATGETIDGSFELLVDVEEGDAVGQPGPIATPGPIAAPEPQTLSLRVTGDLHVGGLMLLIAETVGRPRDWSGHALWWPQRRRWLLPGGGGGGAPSLEALGVGGGARLLFAPRNRRLRLRLPNGVGVRLRLDTARGPPHNVQRVCALLGIRHPEELSLLRPDEEEEGEGGGGEGGEGGGGGRKGRGAPPPPPQPHDLDLSDLPPPREGQDPPPLPPETLRRLMVPWGGRGPPGPPRPPRGNPLLRRARLHARWLDASRSLLEQEVGEGQELLLRFKYLCVLDLDPQRDGLRLSLLQAQARRSLLWEELDCTQEEALLFAALQYQIEESGGSEEPGGGPGGGQDLGDLEAALSKLEVTLGGGTEPPRALEELPEETELEDELEIYRPRRLSLRGFRPARLRLSGGGLSIARSPPVPGEPPQQLSLRGCGVTPDVDLGGQKFCIKLLVAAPEGMSEIQLRCRGAPQFSRWLAGCRLASVGRPLSGGALGAEARGVLGVLGLHPPGGGTGSDPSQPHGAPQRPPPDPRLLLPPRFQRKFKAKELLPHMMELRHRQGALSPAQARLRFLEAWRALPGFGLAHFIVRFKGSRRDEVLAVGPSQLLRLDPGTGSVTRSWRYSALRQWNVNWDSQQVMLELEGEVTLGLAVLSAPCRVLHEFLGGYLCLGGRQPGRPLDLRLLQQLTGGAHQP